MSAYDYSRDWIKWVLAYLVIGLILYAAIWYFFLGGNRGQGYNYSNSGAGPGATPNYTVPNY